MARTNAEEQAWPRFYRLAELRGCSMREAAGTALCLWHQSQSIVRAFGSADEIIEWSSLHALSEDDAQKWLVALQKARLITDRGDGTFLINGNEIQIESMVSKVARASKGGQALKKKLHELKRLKAGSKPATRGKREARRGSNQISSIQSIADQGNAIQSKAKQSEYKNPSDSSLKARAFIAAYCDRFRNRYGHNPEIVGKDARIAGRVVKNWGSEKVDLYLDAFFELPDAWLAKSKHPLSLFESKLNEIVVFAQSGNFTTTRQAQQADTSIALSQQLQQIRNGELR